MPPILSLSNDDAALRLVDNKGTNPGGFIDAWKYGAPFLGFGAEITYSWLDETNWLDNGADTTKWAMTASQRDGMRAAMDAIEDVADITFTVAANPFSTDGEIRFQRQWADWGNGLRSGGFDNGSVTSSIDNSLVTMGATGAAFSQPFSHRYAVHEVMHAIGFPHPGEYDLDIDDPENRPTYDINAEYVQDTTQYTLMSYFGGEHTGAFEGRPGATTLMLHDVMALHILYGANTTAFSGNTVYGFNSHTGRDWWTLEGEGDMIYGAIWDTGGTDWIDVSGFTNGSVVNLREEQFSSFNGVSSNLSIAPGAVIENARGGHGDDLLTGNDVDNLLAGGDGDDTLLGWDGNDTLRGQGGDDWIMGGPGIDEMNGGGGFDTVDFVLTSADTVIDLRSQTALPDGGSLRSFSNFEGAAGGSGDDTMEGTSGSDWFDGNAGADLIRGRAGMDTLHGSAGNDSLRGGLGDDLLFWGPGSDSLNGGVGEDTLDLSEAPGGVSVDLLAGSATRGADTDLVVNVEHVEGGPGNDFILGDAGGNDLSGADGNDTIGGRGGDDALYGNRDNDSLTGGMGSDTLRGGLGNDTLAGGFGFDHHYGGLGIDLVLFTHSDADWIVELDYGTARRFGDANLETVDSIENVQMGGGDDRVYGNAARNILRGGAGDDTIDGRDLADTVRGGAGNDDLRGSAGDDLVRGGNGNDTVRGGNGRDDVHGGNGDDWVIGGLGLDTLNGGAGNDTADYSYSAAGFLLDLLTEEAVSLSGGGMEPLRNFENAIGTRGDDSIVGTGGANVLSGHIGQDDIAGRAGDDDIGGGGGDDTVRAGGGNDTVTGSNGHDELNGGTGHDHLSGGTGHDHLSGGRGNDVIDGGGGDDYVNGGTGVDTMDGGTGNDTVDYSDFGAGWELNLATGIALRGDFAVAEAMSGFENVLSGAGHDTLLGADGANRMESGAGDDRLLGLGGSDTLIAGDGSDSLFGDDGHDRMYAGAGDDSAEGGRGDDHVQGDDGNDTLSGGGGDDSVYGGGGDDLIIAGLGLDLFNGGAGNDTIDYSYSGADWIFLLNAADSATRVGGGTEDISGIENLIASGGNDSITGDQVANLLDAGAGDDSVLAGAGDDTVLGGAGNDTADGGWGNDVVRGDDGNDVLEGGGDDDTVLGEAGDDSVSGGDGDDSVMGGDGNDVVTAGDGADTVSGGYGNDDMVGGADGDPDVFIFARAGGLDRIKGFEQGIDTLWLDDALWGSEIPGPERLVAATATLDRETGWVTFDFGNDQLVVDFVDPVDMDTLYRDIVFI